MRTEADLRAVLTAYEAAAPQAAAVLPRSRRRQNHAWLWATSAAVVALITGLILTMTGGGRSRGTEPAADPSALVNVDWVLVSLAADGGNRVAPAAPAGMTIRSNGVVFAGADTCDQWEGTVSFRADTATFDGKVSGHSCPYSGEVPSARHVKAVKAQVDLITAVLHGQTTWALSGGTLRISRAGAGTLTYSRAQDDPPSPSA